jgi:hypothetical protein
MASVPDITRLLARINRAGPVRAPARHRSAVPAGRTEPGRLSGTAPWRHHDEASISIAMRSKAKTRVCLACAAPMLWAVVHTCYEEAPILMRSGQLVAPPPETHQPETHAEFEFSYIQAALTAVSGGGGAPPPGSIVISGFAPTIEGVRPVLHPGVT